MRGHTSPALWDYQLLSPLPHRNLTVPLHLWASSQPEGVAEPRGTMDVGGGDGTSLDTKPFPCSLSGILIPQCIHVRGLTPNVQALVLSLQVFDPTRFAPGSTRHSHAFLPFSGGSRRGLCTWGSRCHWLLPAVCDCLHSYVEHEVLFLYVDVLRRRPGSPCIRKPAGPPTMVLT